MAIWEIEVTNTRSGKVYRPPTTGDFEVVWKRQNDPGKFTFEVVNIGDLDFQPGMPVMLYRDGKAVFAGYVFKKERSRVDLIKCTAYDQLRYLKYKASLQYNAKSVSELVSMIAADRGLKTGKIVDTAVKLSRSEEETEFFEILNHALRATSVESGKLYVLYDDVGKLSLAEVESLAYKSRVFDDSQIGSYDYSVSIDDGTYDVIDLIVNGQGEAANHVVVKAEDKKIREWGLLQYHAVTTDDTATAKTKAEKLMKLVARPVRSLKLKNCIGDIAIRGGSMIVVRLPLGDLNAYAWFLVESVTHKINGEKHLMDLEVINETFFPAIDLDGAFPNEKKSSSGGGSGGSNQVPEDTNAGKAWNHLRKHGFSAAAAAGIIGNLIAESGLNPTILQNGVGPGTGIAQWENPGRWNNLLS